MEQNDKNIYVIGWFLFIIWSMLILSWGYIETERYNYPRSWWFFTAIAIGLINILIYLGYRK